MQKTAAQTTAVVACNKHPMFIVLNTQSALCSLSSASLFNNNPHNTNRLLHTSTIHCVISFSKSRERNKTVWKQQFRLGAWLICILARRALLHVVLCIATPLRVRRRNKFPGKVSRERRDAFSAVIKWVNWNLLAGKQRYWFAEFIAQLMVAAEKATMLRILGVTAIAIWAHSLWSFGRLYSNM